MPGKLKKSLALFALLLFFIVGVFALVVPTEMANAQPCFAREACYTDCRNDYTACVSQCPLPGLTVPECRSLCAEHHGRCLDWCDRTIPCD